MASIDDILGVPTVDDILGAAKASLDDIYTRAARQWSLDPNLLRAVAKIESGESDTAVSPKGARGRMQLMPATASALDVSDPHDPEQAIPAAARLLRENLNASAGDLPTALMMYHGGTNRRNWGALTQAYPQKVLAEYTPSEVETTPDTGAMPPPLPSARNLPPRKQDFWGHAQQLGNAYLLGAGAPLVAAGTAGRSVVNELMSGGGIDALSRFPDYYRAARRDVGATQKDFETENPVVSQLENVAGTLPASLTAAGAANRLFQSLQAAARFTNPFARTAAANVTATAEGTASAVPGLALSDEPIEKQLATGAVIGGVIGTVGRAGSEAWRAARGTGIDPDVARLAQFARDKDVPIFSWQLRPNSFTGRVGLVSGDAPLSGRPTQLDDQMTAFTRAVSRTIGEDTPKLNQTAIEAASRRIGSEFDAVARRTNIDARDLVGGLTRVEREVANTAIETGKKEAILRQIDNIRGLLRKGSLTGEEYQTLTHHGSSLMRATKNQDPDVKYLARMLREELDNALETTARFTGNTAQIDRLRRARGQWKNLMTVDDILEKGNITGVLDPSQMTSLLNQVLKHNPSGGFVGAGDLGMLAKVGTQFIKPRPGHEAEARQMARNWLVGNSLTSLPAAGYAMGTGDLRPLALTALANTGLVAGGRGANALLSRPARTQAMIDRALNIPDEQLPMLLRRAIPTATVGANQ